MWVVELKSRSFQSQEVPRYLSNGKLGGSPSQYKRSVRGKVPCRNLNHSSSSHLPSHYVDYTRDREVTRLCKGSAAHFYLIDEYRIRKITLSDAALLKIYSLVFSCSVSRMLSDVTVSTTASIKVWSIYRATNQIQNSGNQNSSNVTTPNVVLRR